MYNRVEPVLQMTFAGTAVYVSVAWTCMLQPAVLPAETRAQLAHAAGGRMSAIDAHQNAALAGLGAQFLRRQHHAGRRQDVAEEEEARALRHGSAGGLDDLAGFVRHDGQWKGADCQAETLGGAFPAPVH